MSHFIVAVFTKADGLNVEELLAPYGPEANAPHTCKWDSWKIEKMHSDCLLKLKGSEELVSSAKVKDIDFSPNKELYKWALREWDAAMKHEGKKMYIKYYQTREKFADYMAQFNSYAVVTPDGQWHECGQMGWFGMGNQTPEQARNWHENYARNFLNPAEPEWTLTVINCHI